MNRQGVFIDSFYTPTVIGGPPVGIGDLCVDGGKLWFTIFNPDFVAYPNGYAYAFDMATKEITDTMPLRGRQVLGLTFRGDTAFYVNDNQYSGEKERVYVYSKTLGDTLYSFAPPDPDGVCNPRGIYWDGQYLWLMAERIGNSSWTYKTLYKYSLATQGSPVITTDVNAINFNEVVIGTSTSRSVTVTNTGTGALIINSFQLDNPAFYLSPPALPDTIQVGASKSYNISFVPTVYDSSFGVLNILSNDGGTPVKSISLKGKGIYSGAYIYSDQSGFDYGPRRTGSNCAWYFDIENRGSEILQIHQASAATSNFVLDTTGVTYPLTILPQNSYRFRLWFKPQAGITYSDSVSLSSNSVNQPVLTFSLLGSGISQNTSLGDKLWEGHVPDNPYAYIQDYLPMSMKKIDDVNGDLVNDVMVASRHYLVICYNGNSSVQGDLLWTFNTGTNNNNTGSVMYEDALQVRTDVDGDGVKDVVFGCGGGNEFVYTLSGRTGKMIWAVGDSINYDMGNINGLRADKDFNNDGTPDVLVSASGSGSGGRHSAICLNGINGDVIFNSVQNGQFTFDITTLQNGGAICVDENNGGPYRVNAFGNNGGAVWSVSAPEVVWSLKEINDINGDGTKDIAAFAGGIDVNFYTMSGSNGATLWNIAYPNFATFSTIRVISDLDNNGFSDLIFSGKEGVFRIDSKTSTALWSNYLDGSYVFGTDELGDLNNDGIFEIGAGTKSSNFYILNGNDGTILFQESFGIPIDESVERVIRLNSIDNNSTPDIAVACKNGKIVTYSGGSSGTVSVKDVNSLPLNYELSQNYPNPFNPSTRITYSLKEGGVVKLAVYNILGQLVRVLVNEKQEAGSYNAEFNASGLSSGIYLYKLEVSGSGSQTAFTSTKKLVVLK